MKRVMDTLSDGQWHRQQELLLAIDEMADANMLKNVVHQIRKHWYVTQNPLVIVVRKEPGQTYYTLGRVLSPMING